MRGVRGKKGMPRSADGVLDKSIIDRIMLKFRPIAPKPAGHGSSSCDPTADGTSRSKRKYVRAPKNKNIKREKAPHKTEKETRNDQYKSVVTLQLLPERSGSEDLLTGAPWIEDVVESRVTVECVTDTCVEVDGEGFRMGLSDVDRMKSLEGDTCPGFVSDGLNSVWWVNEAYKKMVIGGGGNDNYEAGWPWRSNDFRVWLVMTERLPWNLFEAAFGCRVRVEYTWGDRKCSRTVPCDVWRMDCGGFAWRLDVKAALSLGI